VERQRRDYGSSGSCRMSPHVRRKSRPSHTVHGWEAVGALCSVWVPKLTLWFVETVIAAYIFRHVLRG
jgi:hypothetical protein